MTETTPKFDYTREELVAICEAAFVPQDRWRNRDTSGAQRQLGECYALLKAGCDFGIVGRSAYSRPKTNEETIWVMVAFKGFGYFDYDGTEDDETYYLPTPLRLDQAAGEDWY